MRIGGVAVAFAASLTVLSAAHTQDPVPAQAPTFKSRTAGVMVDATVRDKNRRSVTGLKASDFELTDNGVPQQVTDVSYGKLPIDITVGLDVSHSVTGSLLERLRQGVVQLMGDLGKDDRLKLVLFNMRVTRIIDYTRDVRAVERAIRSAAAGGGTSLVDAMSVSLVSEGPTDRRQLVVFFTDGSDSTSTSSEAMVLGVARRTRATLAFVVPSNITTVNTVTGTTISVRAGTSNSSYHPLLNALARETGGTIFPVGGSTNLSSAFRTVLNDFRNAYVLYFTPQGVERQGYHQLQVKVKREDAQVVARRGYFGG
jgi:VWFA-related protein